MLENAQPGPPLVRVWLLSAGAVISLGALVWAAGQRTASVAAGQEAGVEAPADGLDDPTRLDDDGRFTGPGEVWPPQPRGATDIVHRSAADIAPVEVQAKLEQLDAAAAPTQSPSEVLAADDDVAAALGERHNLIAAETIDGADRLVYYSLSTNQTIDVTVETGAVTALTLHAPGDFQPELSHDEKLAAVDIARSHWESKGDARIDGLQGYSILAFQPGGAYYDTRMVYVSFHIDEDSRPELLAWVNLATGEIRKSEVDR